MVEMEAQPDHVSNNYLGLTGDDCAKQAAREALDHYGTGVTAPVDERHPADPPGARARAGRMARRGRRAVYTAGYLANTGSIGTLLEPGDTVICDAGDHASILDAVDVRARIRPSGTGASTSSRPCSSAPEGDGGGVLVVVDGVFSMEGDLANVLEVAASAASTAPG